MAEKVFFFEYDGDTRKVVYEGEINCVQDLVPVVEAKYSEIKFNTDDIMFWTKDQTYNVRHKIESPEDIYEGAVLEVTMGVNHKRKRDEEKQESTMKIPRVTGPRFILRLRGLPWSTTQSQIKDFFNGIDLVRVQFLYLPDGRASGDGLVEFKNEEDMEKGLEKDKENIGKRYIDVIKTTAEDMDRALGIVDSSVIKDTKNKVLRMRGLPYSASVDDVLEFFQKGDVIPEKVHIISDRITGRNKGVAFVEFGSEKDIVAALDLNRNEIGNRYIELFRGSMGQLREALGVVSETAGGFSSGMVGNCGNTCIKMRGLPFNTSESDIVNFFEEVDVSPLKIHRKDDGSEAIVVFRSADVDRAMTRQKSYIGHRYVELFRIGYDEVAYIIGSPGRNLYRPFF